MESKVLTKIEARRCLHPPRELWLQVGGALSPSGFSDGTNAGPVPDP